MARVPLEIGPSVAPAATAPDDYQRIDASPAAFGGMIGAAQQQAGAKISQGAGQLASADLYLQNLHNEAVGNEAFNALADGISKVQAGYLSTNGRDAVVGLQGALSGMDATRKQISSQLQNVVQQNDFNRMAARTLWFARERLVGHYTQQLHAWNAETNVAKGNAAIQTVTTDPNNDGAFLSALPLVAQADMAVLHAKVGTPTPDMASQTVHGAFGRVIVARYQALAAHDPVAARDWLLSAKVPVQQQDGTTALAPASSFLPPAMLDRVTEVADAHQKVQDAVHIGSTVGNVPVGTPSLANNVTNLRAVAPGTFAGAGAPQNGYSTFSTPQAGIGAAIQNINVQVGKNPNAATVGGLLAVLTPPTENDTPAYTQRVLADAGLKPGDPVPLHDPVAMAKLVHAIALNEKPAGTVPPLQVFMDTAQKVAQGQPVDGEDASTVASIRQSATDAYLKLHPDDYVGGQHAADVAQRTFEINRASTAQQQADQLHQQKLAANAATNDYTGIYLKTHKFDPAAIAADPRLTPVQRMQLIRALSHDQQTDQGGSGYGPAYADIQHDILAAPDPQHQITDADSLLPYFAKGELTVKGYTALRGILKERDTPEGPGVTQAWGAIQNQARAAFGNIKEKYGSAAWARYTAAASALVASERAAGVPWSKIIGGTGAGSLAELYQKFAPTPAQKLLDRKAAAEARPSLLDALGLDGGTPLPPNPEAANSPPQTFEQFKQAYAAGYFGHGPDAFTKASAYGVSHGWIAAAPSVPTGG